MDHEHSTWSSDGDARPKGEKHALHTQRERGSSPANTIIHPSPIIQEKTQRTELSRQRNSVVGNNAAVGVRDVAVLLRIDAVAQLPAGNATTYNLDSLLWKMNARQ
jgi:hypothetical protein